LRCCTAALLHCYAAALLHCCIAALLHRSDALLCCCTAAGNNKEWHAQWVAVAAAVHGIAAL
jgi:hypothetical protein